jgi:outer membrane protein assembly factor BamB
MAGVAAVLATCSAMSAQPVPATSPAKTVGWRGDGNGRYPDANPPLNWGRVAKSVKELSAQAGKPKDDAAPAKDSAIPDGVIRRWLVLAPIAIPEDQTPEDLLLETKDLSPDADQKTGDLKWKPVNLETSCLDLCAVTGLAPEKKGFMAYAHTYIYSPSGQPVAFNLLSQGQGMLRVWLNGAAIYDIGKNIDLGPGIRLVLPLKKGWNRLLVLNARTLATRRGWWFMGSLYGEKTTDYETHGILWMTPMPSGGTSAPVIVGDKIFFTAEGGSLVCLNKSDGKILWIHSLTYYDFATAEERKANPEIFAQLDPLAEKVKQLDQADCVVPWKPPALEKDTRTVMEGQIFKGMGQVSKAKYNNPATWGCEAGWTPCTPVTDGRCVYALFGTGIVACYDLQGNRKWMRVVNHAMVEHGYATSPLLVDGKLIVCFSTFIELDAKTGEVILERPGKMSANGKPAQFFGTGCVLTVGNEKGVYYVNNTFVRISDGAMFSMDMAQVRKLKSKMTDLYSNSISSPVVDNGVIYLVVHNQGGAMSFKIPALQGDKFVPEIVSEAPFDVDKFPYYYESFYCASPLLHEGLLYCLNDFGVLTVVDMAKGEVAYQKQLDLEVFMPYVGAGALKGGSSSSPTLAGKYIYIWGNQGTCIVIEPGRTFKQVAKNRIESFAPAGPPHQEATSTEPIFEGDRMYYRGEYTLYCIGAR